MISKVITTSIILLIFCALSIIIGPAGFPTSYDIIAKIRIPRLILGIFSGICLSTVGVALQGILQNPLADPYILGIASGACVGAAFAVIFNLSPIILSFIGAVISIFIVYRLGAFKGRIPKNTLLLAGVIVGTFSSSLVMLIMSIARKRLDEIIYLLMGYLGRVFTTNELKLFLVVVSLSVMLFYLLIKRAKSLNILSLGEEEALTIGVEVEKIKKEIFIIASLIIGMCVSFCGAIGFIGLIVPHIARRIIGSDNRKVILFAPIIGIILILFSDIIARTATKFELPIGVITALFGVPFFAYLLRKVKYE